MVQNHLLQARAERARIVARAGWEARMMSLAIGLQVAALVAMEPPVSLAADDMRDEKAKARCASHARARRAR